MIWKLFAPSLHVQQARIAQRHYEEYVKRETEARAIERVRLRAKILAEHKGLTVIDSEPKQLLLPPPAK